MKSLIFVKWIHYTHRIIFKILSNKISNSYLTFHISNISITQILKPLLNKVVNSQIFNKWPNHKSLTDILNLAKWALQKVIKMSIMIVHQYLILQDKALRKLSKRFCRWASFRGMGWLTTSSLWDLEDNNLNQPFRNLIV